MNRKIQKKIFLCLSLILVAAPLAVIGSRMASESRGLDILAVTSRGQVILKLDPYVDNLLHAENLKKREFTFIQITIKEGDRQYTRIVNRDLFFEESSHCQSLMDCPLMVLSEKTFEEIKAKNVKGAFSLDISADLKENRRAISSQ